MNRNQKQEASRSFKPYAAIAAALLAAAITGCASIPVDGPAYAEMPIDLGTGGDGSAA
jgi:hypothetical protein